MTRVLGVSAILAMLVGAGGTGSATPGQTPAPPPPTFRAGVDLVTVSVVSRITKEAGDRSLRQDFELTDAGRVRHFSFRSEPATSAWRCCSTSGSMRIDPKWPNARDAITGSRVSCSRPRPDRAADIRQRAA
jgi:hypothetical protein